MRQCSQSVFLLCLLIAGILISSCNSRKYLPENESLYVGSKIYIRDTVIDGDTKKNLEEELGEVIRPVPNKTFLKMRIKLGFYNAAGEPKKEKGGMRNWIREKLGEAPVLGSAFNPKNNQNILENYLYNRGYFYSQVYGTKTVEDQYARGEFDVLLGRQYKYKAIDYTPADSTDVAKDIASLSGSSLLKSGNPYDLEIIKAERDRINIELKNRGYYYFSPDYLMVFADTTAGDAEVKARMRLRYEIMPQNAYRKYYIREIQVYPQYRFLSGRDTGSAKRRSRGYDTLQYENLLIFQRQQRYRPFLFRKAILFQPGEHYSLTRQNASLNRLVNLNAFKFVKNDFIPVTDSNNIAARLSRSSATYNFLLKQGIIDTFSNKLDAQYLLTSYPRRNTTAELGGYTHNDNRAGSKLSLTTTNRNMFKGAEAFSLKLTTGFEMQYGGQVKVPNTYNAGIEASLNVPRLQIPFFKSWQGSSAFVPRTIYRAGYNFYLRSTLYTLHSFNAGFGYNWKEEIRKDHKLFPINITYVNVDTLNSLSGYDYNISNLLFRGIIFGPTYEYTFNTQADNKSKPWDFYFNGVADLSGNIIGLAQGTSVDENPKTILGARYAQYVKLAADFRYYRALTQKRKQQLATRLYLGFGLPYGNSSQLPNIKQYFAGGSNSLRGFQSRLVGPGTFNEYYLTGKNTFLETLGDMKLEGNIEYRAPIYQFIHGAAFVDAGNVWLLRDNPDFPGGKISGRFLNELAVNAGIGLRFDLSILLVRLDLGMPVRKPWLPQGSRWVFNQINFGDPTWRAQNLILSVAIGYPF